MLLQLALRALRLNVIGEPPSLPIGSLPFALASLLFTSHAVELSLLSLEFELLLPHGALCDAQLFLTLSPFSLKNIVDPVNWDGEIQVLAISKLCGSYPDQ